MWSCACDPNLKPQIGQRPHNPVIAPGAVLLGHANNQFLNCPLDPGSTWASMLRAIELALAAENQILRGQLKGRPKLSDAERARLGEIGRRLDRKALGDVATAALPDTILGWYRRLVAR